MPFFMFHNRGDVNMIEKRGVRFLVFGSILSVFAGCGTGPYLEEKGTTHAAVLNEVKSVQIKPATSTRLKSSVSDSRSESSEGNSLCEIKANQDIHFSILGVATNAHLKVKLVSRLEGCSLTTGYLYAPHIYGSDWQSHMPAQGGPTSSTAGSVLIASEGKLKQIYLSQYNNRIAPESSCAMTSVAMALRILGKNVTADQLSQTYGYKFAQDTSGMTSIAKRHGFSGRFLVSEEAIKEQLRMGNPVVLQTYFTYSGHVVLIVGYNEKGFVFHDPAGKWLETRGQYNSQASGALVTYDYKTVRNLEDNGNYAATVIF